MKWLKYIVFVGLLGYIPTWTQFAQLAGRVEKESSIFTVIVDNEVSRLIHDKTGVSVKTVKISETDTPFAMMVGVPGNPQLIISRMLYETFNPDELDYVLMHEVGHYALRHSVKELIAGIILLVIGLKMLSGIRGVSKGVLAAVLIGLFFGVAMIRLGAYNEIEADHYSVVHMTHPEGMISATEKFRQYYENYFIRVDNKLLRWMFYRGNPYDNRIRMAREQLVK